MYNSLDGTTKYKSFSTIDRAWKQSNLTWTFAAWQSEMADSIAVSWIRFAEFNSQAIFMHEGFNPHVLQIIGFISWTWKGIGIYPSYGDESSERDSACKHIKTWKIFGHVIEPLQVYGQHSSIWRSQTSPWVESYKGNPTTDLASGEWSLSF